MGLPLYMLVWFQIELFKSQLFKNNIKKWMHTLNIPPSKRILKDFRNADFFWKCNLSGIYNTIIDQQNFKAIVEVRNPQ